MIELKEYVNILESMFTKADWDKHDGKYQKGIVAKILSGEPIYLGKDSNGDSWVCKDIDKAKELFKDFDSIESVDDFNKIMSELDGPIWTKIFKGQVSGYMKGLDSGNAGNRFEQEYLDNISNYISKLEEITKKDLSGYEAKRVAGDNIRRPLTFKDNTFELGLSNGYKTVGDSVADIKLSKGDDVLNLSLKSGNLVSFINTGILKIFTAASFDKYKENGTYDPSKDAEMILDAFGIDKNKFAYTFTHYDGKSVVDDFKVDNTDIMKKNKDFKKFMDSVIGYGYVMVHKIGKNIHYIDLTKIEDRDKLISNLKSSTIYYGGKQGKGKRVDIEMIFDNITIKFNFRTKFAGKIYPSYLQADYKINPSYYTE